MYSTKLKSPIADLDVKKRSLLFAELAEIAYKGKTQATKSAKSLGFTTVEYYNIAGAQAYRFMNKDDFVILKEKVSNLLVNYNLQDEDCFF